VLSRKKIKRGGTERGGEDQEIQCVQHSVLTKIFSRIYAGVNAGGIRGERRARGGETLTSKTSRNLGGVPTIGINELERRRDLRWKERAPRLNGGRRVNVQSRSLILV